MATETKVAQLPACDIKEEYSHNEPAAYDGKTTFGPWAYMCEKHFEKYGIGLGTGKGQRLVLREEE